MYTKSLQMENDFVERKKYTNSQSNIYFMFEHRGKFVCFLLFRFDITEQSTRTIFCITIKSHSRTYTSNPTEMAIHNYLCDQKSNIKTIATHARNQSLVSTCFSLGMFSSIIQWIIWLYYSFNTWNDEFYTPNVWFS